MNPNIEQYLMIVRWLLSVGGPLGAYLVSRGIPADQVTVLQGSVIAILGAAPPLVTLVWGLFAHTEAKAVAVVDAIAKDPTSPVKAVIMSPTAAGNAVVLSLPGNTTVTAGSAAAVKAAQA